MIKSMFVLAAAGALLAACGQKTQELELRDVSAVDQQQPSNVKDGRASALDSMSAYGEKLASGTQADFVATVGADRVFFNFDSANLSDDAQEVLKKAAEYIKENDISALTVEGHCDERGTREYNLALGDRRAVSVKKYLVGLGVPAENITTISYGKERPAMPGHTSDAWAQNRRGVLVLN